MAVELLGNSFGYLREERGPLLRVADVLLCFVQDEKCAGQPAILGLQLQGILRDQEKLLSSDIGDLRRKLRLKQLLRLGLG